LRIASLKVAAALLSTASAFAQGPAAVPAQPQLGHFHHLHLNSVDPQAAIQFYTTRFNGERAKLGGKVDAVWTGRSWLLFNKVSVPPPYEVVASLYHLGWDEKDIQAAYQHQLDIGTTFETPWAIAPICSAAAHPAAVTTLTWMDPIMR
jgi:hypothetical protein